MTLFEWIEESEPSAARKVLSIYSICMVGLHFIFSLIGEVQFGSPHPSAVFVAFWGIHWWLIRKSEFKQAFVQAVFMPAFHFIIIIISGTEYLPTNEQVFYWSTFVLFVITWIFPIAVTNKLKKCVSKRIDAIDVDEATGPGYSSLHTESASIKPKDEKKVFTNASSDKNGSPSGKRLDGDANSADAKLNQLREKYSTGRMAIQYRKDAKDGWAQLRSLPVKYQLQYLAALTEDPKSEIESLLQKIKQLHHAELNPFKEEKYNSCFSMLLEEDVNAANEFKRIVNTLGETIDPHEVAEKLKNRYGKIGRQLVEYKDSLALVISKKSLPDEHFMHIFADEFESFVKLQQLSNRKPAQSWGLFILDLYEKCGIDPPKKPND